MSAIWQELCRYGCKTDSQTFFADNYHTVFMSIEYLLGYPRTARVGADSAFADRIIGLGDNSLPSSDEIIKAARLSGGICPEEVENLRFELTERLVILCHKSVKGGFEGIERYITLLADISSLDEERINDALNPVCSALKSDRGYSCSDSASKAYYRERIYRLAKKQGAEPSDLSRELTEKFRNDSAELTCLLGLRRLYDKAAGLKKTLLYIAAAGLPAVTLDILLSAAVLDSPWAALVLFLPLLEACKSVADGVIMRFAKRTPVLRLDPSGGEVSNTRCAIVLSAALNGVQSADSLYERLYRLYAANPQENIPITAVCDLAPEQMPVTSDDRAVISCLDEVIAKLNAICPDKFSCLVRKRTYSETQDEYMGLERKRGAIIELARFMQSGNDSSAKSFYAILGGAERLRGINYICAVDFDTEPYIDSVSELIAVMLHPANSPVVSEGRVVSGCAISAPRMITRLDSSLSSGFARGMGGIGSISSYDRESLDFWQSAFGRGSFCGKGLIYLPAMLECCAWLPKEKILSHDILEGELLNTLYVPDVIFTEGFPKSAVSYYKRADRWIRGDVQNLRFVFSGGFGAVSKLKLSENLRRAITPISVIAALLCGFIVIPETAAPIAAIALAGYLFPYVCGLIKTVLHEGISPRRFFSGLLGQGSFCLIRLFYETVMLPTAAVKSLRAVVTAVFRMSTGKRLLEWTTSAAADRSASDPAVYFMIPEILAIALLFSPTYLIRLIAVPMCIMPIVLLVGSQRADIEARPRLSWRDSKELSRDIANMWSFYADYVTESDNWLPPDNVQFSPVYRICHRTSPTNIGMYLVSVLAACDRRLISPKTMCARIAHTLDSLECMEKYHGNLYNWYETKTLELCPNPYVSSVDSGNLVCSMVALKEGLREYTDVFKPIESLIERLDRLISDTDLGIFYDDVKGLMAIGINPATGSLDRSRYDFLMSEARLTSFYAIASRQVPKSHWLRLSRTAISSGFYSGCASYSGTMFEFFMPELFIKSPESSLMYESLKYALWCQKSYAQSLNRPYGISESGYYAFDSMLSYRYMAHGVPKTGLKRGLWADYVVSPYSTYLSLGYSPAAAMENLSKLREYGMYSRYGFYEALDFTSRSRSGSEPEAVKSYMAHHVGMSIIAAVNALQDGIFQKRFMRDKNVLGASELLCERVNLGRQVYEDILMRPQIKTAQPSETQSEAFSDISCFKPRTKLLSGGEYTLVLTDGGISIAKYRGKNVYSATRDNILRPHGAFFGVSDGETSVSFTLLPDYSSGGECEFEDGGVSYYKNTPRLRAGMRVSLLKSFPCEIRSFALSNTGDKPLKATLFGYIEPSLADDSAEEAHPAFNKMFVDPDYDPELRLITVSRTDSEPNGSCFMAVGFVEDVPEAVSFNREEVLTRPEGLRGLFVRAKAIPQSYISTPDPCVFVRTELELPPKSQAELHMFIICADSKEAAVNISKELRSRFLRQEYIQGSSGAGSRLADRLLSAILFAADLGLEQAEAVRKNCLPLTALWELSVSIDIPLILLKLNDRNDREKLYAYLEAYRRLTLSGIGVQLAVIYDDGGRYEREHYTALVAACKEFGVDGLIYSTGGIIPIDRAAVRQELIDLVTAYARHISSDEIIREYEKADSTAPVILERAGRVLLTPEKEVALGGFINGGESYVINSNPRLPWCHVLSSRQFGTLVSDMSLGFSYAFNSRELRLTPWDNDTARDNIGERLILKTSDGRFIDLIQGSTAVFSPYKADYLFKGWGYSGSAELSVSDKGLCKRLRVKIRTDSPAELMYYTEPCLGFSRRHSSLILPEIADGVLLLSSCASEVKGWMSLSCSQKCRFATLRGEILSGNWAPSCEISGECAAASIVSLEKTDITELDFYLSYAMDKQAAANMPKWFAEQTSTKERAISYDNYPDYLRPFAKEWLRYQALHARIYARTGFYQCSGAYGFRDQLQDAVCIIAENPSVCKAQILRCCMAQFEEGDVLHWWHALPLKKKRGIRTLISDDNLWLPYAVCEYVEKTGDESLLSLGVRYCQGIEIKSGEREIYGEVYPTALRESVYVHCKRAIDFRRGKVGDHGLMLIGTGDWNDGFNSVGEKGRGESVWLSEFFILVLKRFSRLCQAVEPEYAESLIAEANALESAIEAAGKDPEWYKRAYFDDGTPLGSQDSQVCKIDSIAQSFAQFANLADEEFTKRALLAAYERLADVKRGVIKLFAPAIGRHFNPKAGYIQHYPEGLRENGGQYTHGAVWLGMALNRAGLHEEAKQVLDALNPILRSENEGYRHYGVEPYYMSGDVYSNPGCYSRGGWSIYTGSAGWMYRAAIEVYGEAEGDCAAPVKREK